MKSSGSKTTCVVPSRYGVCVLVLYFDKLGAKGRLKLARVAGRAGRVVWDAGLRLTELASVMRGPSDLVLLGSERVHAPVAEGDATEQGARAPPQPSLHTRLVRVDIGSGALAARMRWE